VHSYVTHVVGAVGMTMAATSLAQSAALQQAPHVLSAQQ
jgi:hypothetical protein